MIFLSDHHSWNVLGLLVMTRRCLKETSCQTAEKTKRNWHKVRRRIVGMKSRQWLDAEWCDNVLIAVGKLSLPFHEGRGGGGGEVRGQGRLRIGKAAAQWLPAVFFVVVHSDDTGGMKSMHGRWCPRLGVDWVDCVPRQAPPLRGNSTQWAVATQLI